VCPANANGVVGIKPTVALTSRAGIVPISHTQDTFGRSRRSGGSWSRAKPHVRRARSGDGRCSARLEGAFHAASEYPHGLHPVPGPQRSQRCKDWDHPSGFTNVTTPEPVTAAIEDAFAALTAAGATVIDLDAAGFTGFTDFPPNGELLVLEFDFRNDVQAYFATRMGVAVAGGTLADAIAFNNAHADVEMPYFNQDLWDQAEALAPGPDGPQPVFGGMTYNQALEIDRLSGVNGIDAAISKFGLDAVVTATDNPAWATDLVYGDHFIFGTSGLAAAEGYPIVQVPSGIVFGVPLGISFFEAAFSEPTLIKLTSGYEAFTQVRAHNLPTFARTVPFDHINGPTLIPPGEGEDHAASESLKLGASPTQAKAAKSAASAAAAAHARELRRKHHM